MSVLPKFSARARGDVIPDCRILGLVLLAIACGHSQARAVPATEPVDGAAINTTINPPLANGILDTAPSGKAAAPVLTGNPLWAMPLRSLSVTRERPLFSPSRRPPPSAVAAAPAVLPAQPPKPAEPDHPLLTLVGTIVGQTQSFGIFVDQATKTVIRLKTGQDHAGWTLRNVQGREAIFEKNERAVTLVLPARSATTQAGASVPALIPVTGQPGDVWLDGDGQLIGPPPSPWKNGSGIAPAPSASTWSDGDGQLISPPLSRMRQGAAR